jgi:hypothetical protein
MTIKKSALSGLTRGMVSSFAQMGSLGQARPPVAPVRSRSVDESLQSDWERVGGTMKRTIRRAAKTLEKA